MQRDTPGRPDLNPLLVGALARRLARSDPHRWMAARLAPPSGRAGLAVLYSVNLEIARVRESVSEPMLGAIRLQWWRETIEAIYGSDTIAPALRRRHELAAPLAGLIRAAGLERALFDALIDAREKDLEPTPFARLADLTAYAEATSVGLIALAAQVLAPAGPFGAGAHAVMREAGLAWALAGVLRAASVWAGQGRNLMPAELARDLGLGDTEVAPGGPGFAPAAGRLAVIAANHHRLARRLGAALPSPAFPAIAHVALTPGLLREPGAADGLTRWMVLMAAVLRGRV